MKKVLVFVGIFCSLLILILFQYNCSTPQEQKQMTKDELIARGKYLVNIGGCNDCHSPKVMTRMGPVPDTTRLLSGHPSNEPLGKADPELVKPGRWILAPQDFTAYVGPWGISYAANITPDTATGIGSWTLDTFEKALREGKFMGSGRNLLPPMPWQAIGHLNDEDLKAMFTYLQSIPPVHNQVPGPVPPVELSEVLKKK